MSVFKACDIRGVPGKDLSADLFLRIGRGIGQMMGDRKRIVVGGDWRASTPELKAALVRGLLVEGREVSDLGLAPTPVVYFAKRHLHADACAIVTASHNPPMYNGLKFMVADLPVLPEDMERLQDLVKGTGSFSGRLEKVPDPLPPSPAPGVLPAYKAWVLSEAGGGRPLRVAVDAGNGAYSEIGPDVIEGIPGVTVDRLFCTPDGSFPNRDPNCAVPENLGALRRRVRETGADVGIAFDGDGDRVAFADETGEVVAADEMLVLLMRWIGPRVRGEKVVYDLKCSQVIAREAERLGATALMERSGHAFIKRRMIQERAVLGGEVSGHYFYRELGGGDDGLFSAVRVLRLLQEGRSSLGELRKALPPRFITSDIRIPFPVEESGELMDRLRLAFPPERRSELDGIRISFPHGWGLLRRSITEPKLTLRFEGDSAAALTRIIRENKPSGTPVAWIRAG